MKSMKKLQSICIALCASLLLACLSLALSFTATFKTSAEGTVVTTTTNSTGKVNFYSAGASIRLPREQEVDENGNPKDESGIRFGIRVDLDEVLLENGEYDKTAGVTLTYNGVQKTYTQEQFTALDSGILVIPTKLLDGKELAIGVNGYVKTVDPDWTLYQDKDGTYYLQKEAYIYNIAQQYYDLEYSCRAYFVDGETTVYTPMDEKSERSVSDVAFLAKCDTNATSSFTPYQVEKMNEYLPMRTSVVFPNTAKYLYRVGNGNKFALNKLFALENDANITGSYTLTVDSASVSLQFKDGALLEEFAYSDLAEKVYQFSGTGVATLTIKDEYSRSATTLKVEVVDAENATSATSVTSNNVVLLNDVSGGFSVSGGYTLYGNGFTVTLPTTVQSKFSAGYVGYITVNGGNLDNVRIVGPVYPEMYIYRDQAKDSTDDTKVNYFYNSVLINGGNCTISNSYISGSRTALCIRGGNNVVLENTTLSGGAYANMEIAGASSVTLRNLTTIQTDATDSYGQSKTAHGLGVAVSSNVVDLYIEGDLNQYNWLCKNQWNSIVPSVYQNSFPDFFGNSKFSGYWHYLNGGTDPYVNMAFIFSCNWDTSRIHDNRGTVDYGTCGATIATVAGGVYSKVNTVGGDSITNSNLVDPGYTSNKFNPIAPTFTFDNTNNNDEDDENGIDSYCTYDENSGKLKIGLKDENEKTLDLSGIAIKKAGSALAYTTYLNGSQISGDSLVIKSANGTKQTLTFKVTTDDCGYDKDGNKIAGNMEYSWNITIEVATLSYPVPVWNMGGDYQFDTSNCVYAYYAASQGYGEAVPIYEGIKINYYNKNGTLVNLDLSGTKTLPTGSNNSNDKAFTYTLSDGSTLTMKFSSGWKSGATTHQFTVYNNKVYIYPQSLDSDGYVRSKVANQDFDVKISYTFTDPNGQSTGSQTMQWYNAKASNGSVSQVQWKTFDSTNGKESCLVEGTLITLADGTQKKVEDLTYNDQLLVFNHYTGKMETASLALMDHKNEAPALHRIINLEFSNNEILRIAWNHGLFDVTLNKYVFIDENNVFDFIGHEFYSTQYVEGETINTTITLKKAYITEEVVRVFSPMSVAHMNCFANGILTVSPIPVSSNGHVNYFEYGDGLKYDEEKMQADIERYGLYTYEDFKDYLTEEEYEFLSVQFKYLKVAVGKGLMKWEDLITIIDFLHANALM